MVVSHGPAGFELQRRWNESVGIPESAVYRVRDWAFLVRYPGERATWYLVHDFVDVDETGAIVECTDKVAEYCSAQSITMKQLSKPWPIARAWAYRKDQLASGDYFSLE